MAPEPELIGDASATLYGTTISGGPYEMGTVFSLGPGAHGYTERVLYDFRDSGRNQNDPEPRR